MKKLTTTDVNILASNVALDIGNQPEIGPKPIIYGVPRGGVPVAYAVAMHIPGSTVTSSPDHATVFVDDLIDSGKTMQRYFTQYARPFFALIDKRKKLEKEWIVFPWEGDMLGSIEDVPLRFLQYIGEDPTRDGLKDTPRRVLKSWDELYKGYMQNPAEILSKVFDNDGSYDEMVVLKDIEFSSTCEHHLLPFFGKAHVAYVPSAGGKVVGISKLARLVDCFSRRLQIQERLTSQIADAVEKYLNPLGVAVLVEAQHLCMVIRGIQKQNSVMMTSSLRGILKEEGKARAEFFSIIRDKGRG
jgi:GTP cyclohydrolase I